MRSAIAQLPSPLDNNAFLCFGVFIIFLLTACESSAPATSTPGATITAATPELNRNLLNDLFDPTRGVDSQVVRAIADANRKEFVPVLIELLRFRDSHGAGIPDALEKLTGQSFGYDWFRWVEWLGQQNILTPQGFDAWKADLFAAIDENFRDFLYKDVPTRIKLEEIAWGGVCKDCIPALVNPKFIASSDAKYLDDNELVFGLAINGDVRAYPHRIMDWHEMADDVVGGVPLALTY